MADEEYTVSLIILGKSEEDVARAMETLSRAVSGLVLEGIGVMFIRSEGA